MTENSTNQSKALRLLQVLYDATRDKTEPVFIEEVNTGLSEEDAKAAWRYLKHRGLIDTFNIPHTARINGAGVALYLTCRLRFVCFQQLAGCT